MTVSQERAVDGGIFPIAKVEVAVHGEFPPGISNLVPAYEEGVFVYNLKDNPQRILKMKNGVLTIEDPNYISKLSSSRGILPAAGWFLTVGLTQKVVNACVEKGGDRKKHFANVWVFERGGKRQLDMKQTKGTLSLLSEKIPLFIPVPGKNGVLITSADELNPHTVKLLGDFIAG